MDGVDLTQLKTYELAPDLLLGSALAGTHGSRRDKNWAPLFSSKDFVKKHSDIEVEDF